MTTSRVFDQHHYDLLNTARVQVLSDLLAELKPKLGLVSAIDVGCGLGHFAGFLNERGFQVIAIDGRAQNIEEAGKRWPQVRFEVFNVEDPGLRSLGLFDLVLCFGLLYHLENPFMAIRHLRAMTNSLIVVEGLIYPGDVPLMGLVEETSFEDQGLNHIAFYPTESCIEKMLYRAGFCHVYHLTRPPNHSEYRNGPGYQRNRTMLVASTAAIASAQLREVPEPPGAFKPWVIESGREISIVNRFKSIKRLIGAK